MRAGALVGLLGLFIAGAPGAEATAAPAPEGIAGRTLTLAECLTLGLRQNPATAIAAQSLRASREKVDELRGGAYPTFRFSAGYTSTEQSGSVMASSADSFDNRFSLRQTLFDAGLTADLVAGAVHGAAAAEAERQKTGLDLVLGIQAAFYEVLRRRDVIEVARGALQSAERHEGQARELYQEGLAPRSDVIKAELQVSNAQLEIIRAENALLLAKANLAAAMGQPVQAEFSLLHPEGEAEVPAPSLAEAMRAAVAGRPELAEVKARLAAADAARRQAQSGRYPNVSLEAAYGWQGSSFPPEDRKWSIGLTVGIPVFEQRTARAKVNQAAAFREGLLAVERQVEQAVELEVEQAWLSLKEATERRGVLAKTVEQAEEDQRVSEGRYQEGVGSILEVLDARTLLTQARVGEVIARYDSALARARLDRALGTGIAEEARR